MKTLEIFKRKVYVLYYNKYTATLYSTVTTYTYN